MNHVTFQDAFRRLPEMAAAPIEHRPFINGCYAITGKRKLIKKTSPGDGQSIAPIVECTEGDVNLAVAAANAAYIHGTWRHLPVEDKKKTLFRLAELIEADLPYLAYLDALETGRPFGNFLRDSIPKAIAALRWFTEAVDKLYDYHVNREPNNLSLISREPLGVVGIITPWNDPMVIAIWKATPALLMGNSVVLKPAEQSTFSTLRLAALAKEAGLPDGVLNVVTGTGDVGRLLALHSEVRGIFFTGSSETGKKILTYAGQSNMKKVGLECGGKSPFIVTARCLRLEEAASRLASRMFYNQGQICSAPSRLFVQRSIKEHFLELLSAELPKFLPGNPFHPGTEVGSIVSKDQYERIQHYLQLGARLASSVIQPTLPHDLPASGYYLPPTVLVDIPPDSPPATEEIFGPVLVTHDFEDLSEALHLANKSRYGLAAAIWSDDLTEAMLGAKALDAGIVHVNSYGDDDNSAPFGGVKESGLGKDKSLFAFDDYSVQKTTWINLGSAL